MISVSYLLNEASETKKSWQILFLEFNFRAIQVITADVGHDHFVTTSKSHKQVISGYKVMSEHVPGSLLWVSLGRYS